MSQYPEYDSMRASVERRKNSQFTPDTYGFDDVYLTRLKKAFASEEFDTLLVKLGMKEDGRPEAWIILKHKGETVYVGNFSWTCPPRPPEDCES